MTDFRPISIVIVNWNAGPQLCTCIDSIIKHGHGLVHRTIVVDNGSVDGSDSRVVDLPNVTLISAGKNLGFGKACNLGARDTQSDYILFLNPDAALYDDTLPKALAFMGNPANSNIGICGVQLLDENFHISRHCARFPTFQKFVAHAIGLDRVFPKLGHVMAEWDHSQTRCVDHVIGAFFLVRRTVFADMQGFDERFFVYLEDLDFSYRTRQAGWHSVYLADARAFHAGGGTSKQVKACRLFYSLRSRLIYSFKHFTLFGAVLVTFATLFVEPLARISHALARLSCSGLAETSSGYRMLWGWLPRWLLCKDKQ